MLALLAIIGPGLIVMVGDNDAGGVSTYAQAGQQYGTSLLWVLLLLVPVLVVNQEMVVRLGAVTGVGHARLIIERFGRGWGWFEAAFLLLQNFLIIVTEFIGVNLALAYFGVSANLSVPIAALALVAVTASGSFRIWERSMFLFVFANVLVIPLFFLAHPHAGPIAQHLFIPGIRGGASSNAVLLLIAIVGTTVAPWQLFFQQSNIVDKRITPRWINYERIDTGLGAFVVVLGAGAMICATAFALDGTRFFGHFTNAGGVAHALQHTVGSAAGAFFAVVLLNASLIGAGAVTLATSYVIGDVFGTRGSLHRSFGEAKGFYSVFIVLILSAAAIVLIPGAPLGVITEAVQALCGIVLPMTTLFLLMLCNDREVLGPWTNPLVAQGAGRTDRRRPHAAVGHPHADHAASVHQRLDDLRFRGDRARARARGHGAERAAQPRARRRERDLHRLGSGDPSRAVDDAPGRAALTALSPARPAGRALRPRRLHGHRSDHVDRQVDPARHQLSGSWPPGA